jgi:hypothetical protein
LWLFCSTILLIGLDGLPNRWWYVIFGPFSIVYFIIKSYFK